MQRRTTKKKVPKRTVLKKKSGGLYYRPEGKTKVFGSGCGLLDCVLGGGWGVGRVINIVGDKSTGKTLLAIEACANFAKTYDDGRIIYNEVESAFDVEYARTVGLPDERIEFVEDPHTDTVEELFASLQQTIKEADGKPILYIVDSLDALTTEVDREKPMEQGTYGMAKPKLLGKLFREVVRKLKDKNITFIIISQIRANIGVVYGKQHTRSGGKALDFYASQILWLTKLKQIVRTRKGIKRDVAVRIRSRIEKNKLGPPYRDCEFNILFSYGIDDVMAGVDFLHTAKQLELLELGTVDPVKIARTVEQMDRSTFRTFRCDINKHVKAVWRSIEEDFQPKRSKYA